MSYFIGKFRDAYKEKLFHDVGERYKALPLDERAKIYHDKASGYSAVFNVQDADVDRLETEVFDRSTLWNYYGDETTDELREDALRDISEIAAYIRNNPGAHDREDMIDLLTALSCSLYYVMYGHKAEQTA